MPTYEMRCRTCGARFDVVRPMSRIDEAAPCPAGHVDTVRLLPTVALTGLRSAGTALPPPTPAGGGGGCCGGGCGCG